MIGNVKASYYLFLFFVIGCLAGAIVSCSKINNSEVTLVNKTSEKIKRCSVSLAGENFTVDNFKAGDKVSTVFVVRSDAHYRVTVTFYGGRKLEEDVGYVTNGFDYRDTILVYSDKIALSSSQVR
jgi:hypothetical protein